MNKNELSIKVEQTFETYGPQRLGVASSFNWVDDPRRMAFSFARYKFVAKMLEGKKNVVEIGCADGFASRIVCQTVQKLSGLDIVEEHIASAKETCCPKWPINFFYHDMLSGSVPFEFGGKQFDAAFSMDVLEHIEPSNERLFITNIISSLAPHATLIVGMPSIESQAYASELSKIGHVNCKTQPDLKKLMSEYFRHVFMFAFNDETLHTGYHKMAHYNLAVCVDQL